MCSGCRLCGLGIMTATGSQAESLRNAALRIIIQNPGGMVFDGECRTEHFMRLERAAYVPDVNLRRVHEDKGRYMELLLVGDEQESMVRKYLPSVPCMWCQQEDSK